jgi:hypothetical protein
MAGPRFVGAVIMAQADYPLVTLRRMTEKFHKAAGGFPRAGRRRKKKPRS